MFRSLMMCLCAMVIYSRCTELGCTEIVSMGASLVYALLLHEIIKAIYMQEKKYRAKKKPRVKANEISKDAWVHIGNKIAQEFTEEEKGIRL